jgi:hypothetical protein
LGDLIGRQSGVTPNHTDHLNIDSGKMSVGVLVTTKGVIKSTSKAATTNVYGRRRARRTIHITPLRCA